MKGRTNNVITINEVLGCIVQLPMAAQKPLPRAGCMSDARRC